MEHRGMGIGMGMGMGMDHSFSTEQSTVLNVARVKKNRAENHADRRVRVLINYIPLARSISVTPF